MSRDTARGELVRRLRALKRFEQRVSGGSSAVWEEYFSTRPAARVRYPLATMLAFDRESRRFATDSFFEALFAKYAPGARHGPGGSRRSGGPKVDLRELLGLGEDADAATVRERFREVAMSTHPDLGGDTTEMAGLLEAYQRWREEG